MVSSPEAKPLHNRLNLDEGSQDWLDGKVEPKYTALQHPFGDSRLSNVHVMRTREFALNGLEWNQFGFVNAAEIVADPQWKPVLQWLEKHPYALFVTDVELAAQGGKRERVIIDDVLRKKQTRTWVGPDRYAKDISMFLQRDRAEEEGINCQVAVHIVAEALNKGLSREERSGELYENYEVFDPTEKELEVGDIVFFYERGQIADAKSLHVTTCVGKDMGGVPLLLHATSQPIKSRPGAEIIPITQLLTNRQRYCYGAIKLPTREWLPPSQDLSLGEV